MASKWQKLSECITESTLTSIAELKFDTPTPVQAACIPLSLTHKDVAAEAITGSGKTLAFVIPIIETLKKREDRWKKHEVGALVITPTRELASQIFEVVKHFLKNIPDLTCSVVIGGKTSSLEDDNVNGGNIVIGTPGRLEAALERKSGSVSWARRVKSLEVLVLDEADRLLDMGFEVSINTILQYLPKQRRTGLFSATQTDEVEKLIRAGLRNPVRVSIKEKSKSVHGNGMESDIQRTPSTLQNYYLLVEADEKLNVLVHFLQKHRREKTMLFLSTCAGVDYFSKILPPLLKRSQVYCIHGKMKNRKNVISKFRAQVGGVLLCTDVMARGIDIPDVHWVIQYDPPTSATAFVHRCGRTARIGNVGSAVVFLQPHEDSFVKFIELNQKVPLLEMTREHTDHNFIPQVQTMAINDRDVYEKGKRAYVSFVQSYIKHECYTIFNIKKLDFGRLATGFGLIKIPRMPETKGKVIDNFVPIPVNTDDIEYCDKAKEKVRKQKLEEGAFSKNNESKRKPQTESWSQKKGQKAKKRKRKEIKELKKRKISMTEEDLDELDDDIRMMKKLKNNKITQEEFDREFISDEDEDDS